MIARDENGRFLPGTSGNPGGRSNHCQYKALIDAACTPEKWGQIVDRAIADAIDGDRFARRFLANYLMGAPRQYVEIEEVMPLDQELRNLIERVYGD